jgi:hypothetical protein
MRPGGRLPRRRSLPLPAGAGAQPGPGHDKWLIFPVTLFASS